MDNSGEITLKTIVITGALGCGKMKSHLSSLLYL